VFGRGELNNLAAQKQTLLVESSLNRLVLRGDWQNLRSSAAWIKAARGETGGLLAAMLVLAPLAGFLLARSPGRSGSWLSRATAVARWAARLYDLWTRFSAHRQQAPAAAPPPAPRREQPGA